MRRVMLTTLSFLFCAATFAQVYGDDDYKLSDKKRQEKVIPQVEQIEMQGIGFLQIGITKTSIIDSLETKGYKVSKEKDWGKYFDYDGNRKILVPEFNGEDAAKMPPDQTYDFYKIGQLRIGQYLIKNIELKFSNEVLYSITIDEPPMPFIEALKIRYKKQKVEKEETESTCNNGLNGRVYRMNTTLTTIFVSPPNIRSAYVINQFHTYNCSERIITMIYISDVVKSREEIAISANRPNKISEDDYDKIKGL